MAPQPSASQLTSPWRKVRKYKASSLRRVFSDYNKKVIELQSQVQSPPVDIPERAVWAKKIKEESLKLAANFTELAADALVAASVGFPGTMEVRKEVGKALQTCATCANSADTALLTWSVQQSCQLSTEDEPQGFEHKAQVLNRSAIDSVSQAVKQLNDGSIVCPEGYCVVYSSRAQAYFALYRSDKKDATLMLFDYQAADDSA